MAPVRKECTGQEPQVWPSHPSLPCATVLRLIRDLLGAPGCLATVMSRSFYSLIASVGATGPHDFAVRDSSARLARRRSHRIPLPTSVTIAIRPSPWRRDGERKHHFPKRRSEIFLAHHLDRKGRLEKAGGISRSAQASQTCLLLPDSSAKSKSRR